MRQSEALKRFSVVDVETTGFYKSDRICEIAIVDVDLNTLEIVDEFETLVNPERDVGPVHVHRITPTMILNAPKFEDVANMVAEHLNNSVLVAHNLSFDSRFFAQEFQRLEAEFSPGKGVCTLRMTGERLSEATKRHGIKLEAHHRALADARASAELFKKLFEEYEEKEEIKPVRIEKLNASDNSHILCRDDKEEDLPEESLLSQVCSHVRYPTSEPKILEYLDIVNSALADLYISQEERVEIEELAKILKLLDEDVKWANEAYLQTLICGAKRDGIITAKEKNILDSVADLLQVPHMDIPKVTKGLVCKEFKKGTRMCFTGTAILQDGQKIERRKLEALAAKVELQPVANVTKRGCDLLVAQDINSLSGKAKKAREYNIRVISVDEFLEATNYN